MATLNQMKFDSVSPEALEVAEGAIRHLNSPFATRAFRGAQETMLAAKGRYAGAGARKAEANELTASTLRALRFRTATQVGTSEDVLVRVVENTPDQAAIEAHERAKQSEEAADAEWARASSALTDAKTVFHRMVLWLFESAQRDETLRAKNVTPRSGDEAGALRANRAEQSAKRREREPVRNSTPPNAVYESQIAAQLDALGDPFKIGYSDGIARWNQPTIVNGATDQNGHYITERDLLPLIVALNRDEVQRRLLERIARDHAGDSTLRLTAEEKHARLGQLRSELLELEREEAALIVTLAGNSAEIVFRPDASPPAMLGLEVVDGKPTMPAKKRRSGEDVVMDALASIGIEL